MVPPTDSDNPDRQLSALEASVRRLQSKARRQRRRVASSAWGSRLAGATPVLAILLVSAVTIKNADFEIHPNVVGGNPNDSYALKLVGDGSTGADRAMSLRTVPTTDSDYRLAISDNGDTERFSITDDGEVGIGDTTPSYLLDVNGDSRIGWHGDSSRIKIGPADFLGNDDDSYGDFMFENDTTAKGVRVGTASVELYAFVFIPKGYEATHVRIYGNSTDTVTVYETDIDTGTWSASLGSAATGTEINITDVTSDSTNYLVIQVAVNSTADVIYGGYVTIARQ